jgi:hypothetical protein
MFTYIYMMPHRLVDNFAQSPPHTNHTQRHDQNSQHNCLQGIALQGMMNNVENVTATNAR